MASQHAWFLSERVLRTLSTQALAQRRRPADQKGYDILYSAAAAAESRRDERRQAATAAEMQVKLLYMLRLSLSCMKHPVSGRHTSECDQAAIAG